MNQLYTETGRSAQTFGRETASVSQIIWHDERSDAALEMVRRALHGGESGTARLRLMQLTEHAQADVMRQLPPEDAAALARGLSNYSLATICERLPTSNVRSILQSIPAFKRQGIEVILAHRRHL